jgi:hypothetical protein
VAAGQLDDLAVEPTHLAALRTLAPVDVLPGRAVEEEPAPGDRGLDRLRDLPLGYGREGQTGCAVSLLGFGHGQVDELDQVGLGDPVGDRLVGDRVDGVAAVDHGLGALGGQDLIAAIDGVASLLEVLGHGLAGGVEAARVEPYLEVLGRRRVDSARLERAGLDVDGQPIDVGELCGGDLLVADAVLAADHSPRRRAHLLEVRHEAQGVIALARQYDDVVRPRPCIGDRLKRLRLVTVSPPSMSTTMRPRSRTLATVAWRATIAVSIPAALSWEASRPPTPPAPRTR